MITEKQPGKHCTCENTAWLTRMSSYCDVIWEHDREIETVILFLLGGENSQPEG